MSEFDPFEAMRAMDGPVHPSEQFGEALYDTLRAQLDESAVGAPHLPPPSASLPRRGLVVAGAALASVLLMVGLLSWLAPAEESDVAIDPPLLSRPETPTSAVDHNPDPAVVSPGTVLPATSQPPATQNRGGYQFGGWQVLPASEFDGRQGAGIVWTGDQLIVWGGSQPLAGYPLNLGTDTGGTFDPANDVWISMPPSPLSARDNATALWTGDEMLILGGGSDAAAYDPATRLWRELQRYEVPSNPAAVWTGSEAILWGGPAHSGVAYDPVTDRWRNIAAAPASEWENPQAVWTGTEMIVWSDVVRAYFPAAEPVWAFDIAAYNPSTDSWRQFAPSSIEFELSQVTGVWTGEELVLFGANFDRRSRDGELAGAALALGVSFNPTSNEWRRLADPPFGDADQIGLGNHSAAWSGSRMLVWVGAGFLGAPGPELWSYDPAADTWERGASSPVNAEDPQLIWTGDALYAYGGSFNEPLFRMLRIDLGPDGAGLPEPVGTTTSIGLTDENRVPFEVLAIERNGRRSLYANLAADLATVYELDESLLLPSIASAAPLWDGWMTSARGEVTWYPDGITRQPVGLQGEGGLNGGFAPFSYFLPIDGDLYSEGIWTIVPGAGYGSFDEPSTVRQVSIPDGAVVMTTELPPDVAPVNSARTGLLLNQIGWTDTGDGFVEDPATREMMLVEPDGTVAALWHGWGLDLSLNRVVWLDCDDEGADCRVVLSSVDGSRPADLAIGDDSVTYAPLLQPGVSIVSPDGHWLIIEQIQTSRALPNTALVRIDLTNGEVDELITYSDLTAFVGQRIAWSTDSQWVMVVDAGPIAIRISDGHRVDLSEVVPDDMRILAVASR